MAGRVFANARTRGMLCEAGFDLMRQNYVSVAKSTMIHAPQLEQSALSYSHRVAIFEISRRHSVMLHRSGILPSAVFRCRQNVCQFQFERFFREKFKTDDRQTPTPREVDSRSLAGAHIRTY
jgi:hypothetical protein